MHEFKATRNRFLKVAEGVVLTEKIDPVICALDKHFEKAGMKRTVVSGFRLAQDQLRIIINYCKKEGMPNGYKETDVDARNPIGQYIWQYDWSTLLAKGFLINPPRRAEILTEYLKGGVQQKGRIVEPSSHFNGTAFDISGSGGDQDPGQARTVEDETKVVQDAMKDEPGIGIRSFTVERKNNCLHINV